MSNLIKRIKEGEKLVLWVGDAISKAMGLPSKKDLARTIYSEIKGQGRNFVTNKKSLSEVSQTYLDSLSGSKYKLLQRIKNQLLLDEKRVNPMEVFAIAPFIDTIITTSIDDIVERAYGDEVFKVDYYSETFEGKCPKKLYRINGSLDDINKLIITKQDIRKLDVLPIYGDFFDRIAEEISGKILLFIGYDLDDPDAIESIEMALGRMKSLNANAYFITSSSIISTSALTWLNNHDIKLLKQTDMEFIEVLKDYLIEEGLLEGEDVVELKKKTLSMS